MSQLISLIKDWEAFLQIMPKGNYRDFITWSYQKQSRLEMNLNGEVLTNSVSNANDPAFHKYEGRRRTSMQAAYLFVRLSQYVFFYTKPMMRKHGLYSLDDFGYLQNIRLHDGEITKSKVCELMLHEVTTGADIIKRLIRNGFAKEKVNNEDKRSKLLALSAKGNKVLDSMSIDFATLPDTLVAMPEKDRDSLLQWLIELDILHNGFVKSQQTKEKK